MNNTPCEFMVYLMQSIRPLYTGNPYLPFICILVLMLSRGKVHVSAVQDASPPNIPSKSNGDLATISAMGSGVLSFLDIFILFMNNNQKN